MQASRVIMFAAALLATSVGTAMATEDARDHAIAVARESLGRDLGNQRRRIALAEASAAEWSDGSLGCPRPGMYCTHPGARQRLSDFAERGERDE